MHDFVVRIVIKSDMLLKLKVLCKLFAIVIIFRSSYLQLFLELL